MAAPYTIAWDQTFGNRMRNLFSKQLIKCPHILPTSKLAFIGYFPSKTSSAKAITKGPQLYPTVCFWTGTQFLYDARTHFLFTPLRDVFKLSQIWILPLPQKVSSHCQEPS